MKILAVSDIHGNHDTYAWLAQLTGSLDVKALVLAGDLLGTPDGINTIEEAQKHEAARVVGALSNLNVPVLYIMGNDDWVDLRPGNRSIRSLHGCRIDLGCYSFVGYQYTLPFMGGVNEKRDDEIAADLSGLRSLLNQNTVFVSHSPARGILDTSVLGSSVGSESIRNMLRETPFLAHIHGHIHECFGREGRHFNVAAGHARRAVILDLETLEHEVVS